MRDCTQLGRASCLTVHTGLSSAPGDQFLPSDTLVLLHCCWGAGGAGGRRSLLSLRMRVGVRGQAGLAIHPACPWSSILQRSSERLKHDLHSLVLQAAREVMGKLSLGGSSDAFLLFL